MLVSLGTLCRWCDFFFSSCFQYGPLCFVFWQTLYRYEYLRVSCYLNYWFFNLARIFLFLFYHYSFKTSALISMSLLETPKYTFLPVIQETLRYFYLVFFFNVFVSQYSCYIMFLFFPMDNLNCPIFKLFNYFYVYSALILSPTSMNTHFNFNFLSSCLL